MRSATSCGRSMWMKWPVSAKRVDLRVGRQVRAQDLLGRVPSHRLRLRREETEHRHRQTGQPQQRPLRPPRTEAAEAHRRIELPAPAIGVVLRAGRDEIEQPLVRQARVHAATPARELLHRAGLARGVRDAAAMVEPAGQFLREQSRALVLGDVRVSRARGQPVDVHELRDAVRAGVGQMGQQRPALRVPDQRNRLARHGVEHRQRVAHVGVPGVERGVLRIAVAALIPRYDAEAAGREQRREDVVGAREIEAAVGEQQRRRPLVAPFVHRDAKPARVDEAAPRRRLRAGVRDRRRLCRDRGLTHRARSLGRAPPRVRRCHCAAAGSRRVRLPRCRAGC